MPGTHRAGEIFVGAEHAGVDDRDGDARAVAVRHAAS